MSYPLDGGQQVLDAGLGHIRGRAGLEEMLLDLGIDRGREDHNLHFRVILHDSTARLQSVNLREVHVEHKHVRLEPLHGFE